MKNICLLLLVLLTTATTALHAQHELYCQEKWSNNKCAKRYNKDKEGRIHGQAIFYHPDGSTKATGAYDRGYKQGQWKEFLETNTWSTHPYVYTKYWQIPDKASPVYVWYEEDELIAVSTSPIASLSAAQLLRKKTEQYAEKVDAEAKAKYEQAKQKEEEARIEEDKQRAKREAEREAQRLAQENAKQEAELRKLPNISPDSVKFNRDSYIPTRSTYNRLLAIGKRINQYNSFNPDKKIKDVYIITHTNNAFAENNQERKRQESVLFYLSLNRAVTISFIMAAVTKDVTFHLIPVSGTMPLEDDVPARNIRADIVFEESQYVTTAKASYAKLSKTYKVSNTNGEYAGFKILTNEQLRENVLWNLKQNVAASRSERCIPLELWDNTLGKNEDGLQEFKKQLVKIAGSEERVHNFIHKPII